MSHRTSHLYLPGTVEAVAHARDAVVATMREWGFVDSEWLNSVALIVTELVSNSVRHARGRINIDLDVDSRVLLTVIDLSPDHPRVVEPSSEGGRGMHIVEAMCPRWGVRDNGTGKETWVELPPPPGR